MMAVLELSASAEVSSSLLCAHSNENHFLWAWIVRLVSTLSSQEVKPHRDSSELTGTTLLVQISDGASAVLLMKRSEALKRGLPILGIFRSFAAVGVDPAVMGIGPAVAIPAALEKAGLTTDDVDLYELNEAFASQVWACTIFLLHVLHHRRPKCMLLKE